MNKSREGHWIRSDGTEVSFENDDALFAAIRTGQVGDDDLVRLPHSRVWQKAREIVIPDGMPVTSEQPSEGDASHWVCGGCGVDISDDAATCPACGEDVTEVDDGNAVALSRPLTRAKQAAWFGLIGIVAFTVARSCSSTYYESDTTPRMTIGEFLPGTLGDLSSSEIRTLERLCDEADIHGMAACHEYLWELGMMGLTRLSDEDLMRRAQLLEASMGRMGTEECAAASQGVTEGEAMRRLFDLLDEEEQEAFASLYLRAAARQGAGVPPVRMISDTEAELALDALDERLSPRDADRLWATVERPLAVTVDDMCWGGRLLYRMTGELAAPHGANLARLFAGSP